MFWKRYARVVWTLVIVGTVVGGLLFFVVFGFLLPPDRGEESAVPIVVVFGVVLGAATGVAASLGFALAVWVWTRGPARSPASIAAMAALGAGGGVALSWAAYGLATWTIGAWTVWGAIAVVLGLLAAAVAAPATARAVRRAERR